MVFHDREEAARRLAAALDEYEGKNPLVLAIPRGAVPMAKIIAAALGGEMDVVLVRKLRAPGNPELAIGSVDESGQVYLGEYVDLLGAGGDYLQAEVQEQMDTMRRRRASYTPVHVPIDPAHRIVIVVDDGIATGSTMIAALRAVRARGPAKLIAATAVAPAGTVRSLQGEADRVVCLHQPAHFFAIGQFFEDFRQVSDEEVVALLRERDSRPAFAAAEVERRHG